MLRDYQLELKNKIYAAWHGGARNVMATMATGGGKSVVIGSILQDFNCPSVVMAHRSELVSQLALTLNRENVPHGVIAPKKIIQQIIALEVDTHGRSFYSARAPIRVASAHTLARRDAKDRWYSQVALAVVDEGHHVIKESVWDRAMQLFPSARGLLKTAHAVRADGAGLGRDADGVVDALVVGPWGRDLIDRGYLCDFTVKVPPTDIDISEVEVGPSGEFVYEQLRAKIHASRAIVGSIVKQYLKFAEGKLGLTFAVDIEEANKIRAEYLNHDVPAEIITADTPIPVRAAIMRRFRARQLLQLVSVDVLSEGVDVPAVEVVSLGRPTMSWQLYCQQVGRALRPMIEDTLSLPDGGGIVNVWRKWDQLTDEQRRRTISLSGKPRALIIDHVDNVRRHYLSGRGMFDSPQTYTLERRERKSKKPSDVIPQRACLNEDCFQMYDAYLLACPYCGTPKPAPGRRATPDQVEGDLLELDVSALRALAGELARVDGVAYAPKEASAVAIASLKKNHLMRQIGQSTLRPMIALWAGWKKQSGLHDREIQRLFWHTFGVDVMTAQTLGSKDAIELEARIEKQLGDANVVAA